MSEVSHPTISKPPHTSPSPLSSLLIQEGVREVPKGLCSFQAEARLHRRNASSRYFKPQQGLTDVKSSLRFGRHLTVSSKTGRISYFSSDNPNAAFHKHQDLRRFSPQRISYGGKITQVTLLLAQTVILLIGTTAKRPFPFQFFTVKKPNKGKYLRTKQNLVLLLQFRSIYYNPDQVSLSLNISI